MHKEEQENTLPCSAEPWPWISGDIAAKHALILLHRGNSVNPRGELFQVPIKSRFLIELRLPANTRALQSNGNSPSQQFSLALQIHKEVLYERVAFNGFDGDGFLHRVFRWQ